jgi:hypothetical protein
MITVCLIMHFLVTLCPGHYAYYSICLFQAPFTPVPVVLIVKVRYTFLVC